MGMISASHTVEIDAPIAKVYEVAADVPGAVVWNPAMDKIDVIETDADGHATLVEVEADVKVKKSKSILRFTFDNEPNGLTWKQESGDVKSVDGRWELSELDGDRTKGRLRARDRPRPSLGHAPARPRRGPGQDVPDEGRSRGPEGPLRSRLI